MNAKPQANEVSVIEQSRTALAVATPMTMLAQAVERGMAPETIDKLMALAERWDKTQARKAFDIAIAAAKVEIPVIGKNATGHNSKKYADFAAIARVVDPIIGKHGLSYRFRTVQTDKISVTCVLSHEAGHCEETTLSGPSDTTGNKNAIQAIGSTLTYLQRYSLVQALGLAAAEDDDGRSGGVKTIAADEMQNIRDIIAVIGDATVEARLLRWLKVDKIEHIPLDRYEDAVENLKKVKRS